MYTDFLYERKYSNIVFYPVAEENRHIVTSTGFIYNSETDYISLYAGYFFNLNFPQVETTAF